MNDITEKIPPESEEDFVSLMEKLNKMDSTEGKANANEEKDFIDIMKEINS